MEALFERCLREAAACFRQGKPPVMHPPSASRLQPRPLDGTQGKQCGKQLSSAAIVSSALVLLGGARQPRRRLHWRGPSRRGP